MTDQFKAKYIHTWFQGYVTTLEAIQLADAGYTSELLEAKYEGLPKAWVKGCVLNG